MSREDRLRLRFQAMVRTPFLHVPYLDAAYQPLPTTTYHYLPPPHTTSLHYLHTGEGYSRRGRSGRAGRLEADPHRRQGLQGPHDRLPLRAKSYGACWNSCTT